MMGYAKVYQLHDEKRVMALAFVDKTTYTVNMKIQGKCKLLFDTFRNVKAL
jgi:hypothetical protein